MKRLARFSTLSADAPALAACRPAGEASARVTPTAEAPAAPPEAAHSPAGDKLTAAGDTRSPDAAGIPGSDCVEFQPKNVPENLWVMRQAGKPSRITIADMSIRKTDKGPGLGDTAEAVKGACGATAAAIPHTYQDAPADYITVWEGGPRAGSHAEGGAARGIVCAIDATGKVGAIHAGGPSILYVEGCA